LNKFTHTYEKALQVLSTSPARVALLSFSIVGAAWAQDSVTTLAASANTTSQTVANSLGLVVIVVGLIAAAISKRIGVAVGACFIGGALAAAPKLYSTFTSYF